MLIKPGQKSIYATAQLNVCIMQGDVHGTYAMLHAGADPNFTKYGNSTLLEKAIVHYRDNPENSALIIKGLVAAGVDLNVERNGYTDYLSRLVSWSSRFNRPEYYELFALFIQAGVDLDDSIYFYSIEKQIRQSLPRMPDEQRENIENLIAQDKAGTLKISRPTLTEFKPDFLKAGAAGYTPLHAAIYEANETEVSKHLTDTTQLDSMSTSGITPLHMLAIAYSDPSKRERLLRIASKLCDAMHANNLDISINGVNDQTPLHQALYFPAPDCALSKLLVSKGADTLAEDEYQITPYEFVSGHIPQRSYTQKLFFCRSRHESDEVRELIELKNDMKQQKKIKLGHKQI